jgi:hypothetical protein
MKKLFLSNAAIFKREAGGISLAAPKYPTENTFSTATVIGQLGGHMKHIAFGVTEWAP